VRCDSVETNFVELSNIPPFEEEIIHSSTVKVVHEEIYKDIESPIPSILNFLEESIVEPRNIGT
jgi:hypothetical protein